MANRGFKNVLVNNRGDVIGGTGSGEALIRQTDADSLEILAADTQFLGDVYILGTLNAHGGEPMQSGDLTVGQPGQPATLTVWGTSNTGVTNSTSIACINDVIAAGGTASLSQTHTRSTNNAAAVTALTTTTAAHTTSIASLDARVDVLEPAVATATSNISSLQTTQASQGTTIATHSSEIQSLGVGVATNGQTAGEAYTLATTANTTANTANTTANTANTTANSASSAVATLNTQVGEIQDEVDLHQTQIGQLFSDYTTVAVTAGSNLGRIQVMEPKVSVLDRLNVLAAHTVCINNEVRVSGQRLRLYTDDQVAGHLPAVSISANYETNQGSISVTGPIFASGFGHSNPGQGPIIIEDSVDATGDVVADSTGAAHSLATTATGLTTLSSTVSSHGTRLTTAETDIAAIEQKTDALTNTSGVVSGVDFVSSAASAASPYNSLGTVGAAFNAYLTSAAAGTLDGYYRTISVLGAVDEEGEITHGATVKRMLFVSKTPNELGQHQKVFQIIAPDNEAARNTASFSGLTDITLDSGATLTCSGSSSIRNMNAGATKITNLAAATVGSDAVRRDQLVGVYVPLSGSSTISGDLTVNTLTATNLVVPGTITTINQEIVASEHMAIVAINADPALEITNSGTGATLIVRDSDDDSVVIVDNEGRLAFNKETGSTCTIDAANCTDCFAICRGTTAQRPSNQPTGALRFNTSTDQFEGVTSAGWGPISGSEPPDWSNVAITGGTVNNATVGATTASSGRFTTITGIGNLDVGGGKFTVNASDGRFTACNNTITTGASGVIYCTQVSAGTLTASTQMNTYALSVNGLLLKLPAGTTAQRPGTVGCIFYNEDTDVVEWRSSSGWVTAAGGFSPTITSPAAGDTLVYNGTNWVNQRVWIGPATATANATTGQISVTGTIQALSPYYVTETARQFQVNASDSWGSPTYDSGEVSSSATYTPANLPSGTWYYRARRKSNWNVWSEWALAQSFAYIADKIAQALSTSLAAYMAAAVGAIIHITQSEYENLSNFVTSTVIAGIPNASANWVTPSFYGAVPANSGNTGSVKVVTNTGYPNDYVPTMPQGNTPYAVRYVLNSAAMGTGAAFAFIFTTSTTQNSSNSLDYWPLITDKINSSGYFYAVRKQAPLISPAGTPHYVGMFFASQQSGAYGGNFQGCYTRGTPPGPGNNIQTGVLPGIGDTYPVAQRSFQSQSTHFACMQVLSAPKQW